MSQPAVSIDRFFVYGTLCRGQCREKCWPCQPLEITPGWTLGTLYGRADYPAMRPGNDRVRGECWRFDAGDLERVRTVLNQIEVTDQPGVPNLYDAVSVNVYRIDSIEQDELLEADCIGVAQAYHYSIPPERDGFVKLTPKSSREISWPE
ncbi:gamma-glutamylcyclotransferase family protein [Allorhodopirellula heiligendammensis]|uniref:AIG2-like family protein n=1 Tax=Allorhodopirellula heiligendammensis TaxID=2714739 RepID=A0A5C6BWZ7_9BACT|nr:gamma-glutamylcyclotransferase family protein [Allorhodopirellula heiligendammensis]TWU16167.1 AIG2-like family protein [Allorhodopirellula heiligendammensis]